VIAVPAPARRKVTFTEMRTSGTRGLLVYWSDYKCSHWTAISGDQWPDEIRLSDIETRFTYQAYGRRGADLRPNFHWERTRDASPQSHSRPNSDLMGQQAVDDSGDRNTVTHTHKRRSDCSKRRLRLRWPFWKGPSTLEKAVLVEGTARRTRWPMQSRCVGLFLLTVQDQKLGSAFQIAFTSRRNRDRESASMDKVI
jgi:hypothetical protein